MEKNLLLITIAISQFLFSCGNKSNKDNKNNNEEQQNEQPKINEDKSPKDKVDENSPNEDLEDNIPKDNSKFVMHHDKDIKPFLNVELIKMSCAKSQNQYNKCDFSEYTNKSLTKTKIFSLPMEFKVSYTRGECGSRFENGKYIEGNFILKFATPEVSRSIYPGQFRSTLIGNSLILKDEDPRITRIVGYFEPCFFMIRKIAVDFSQSARDQIKTTLEKNDNRLNLKTILQEIESEPNFNKSSLEDFKNKLRIKDEK